MAHALTHIRQREGNLAYSLKFMLRHGHESRMARIDEDSHGLDIPEQRTLLGITIAK